MAGVAPFALVTVVYFAATAIWPAEAPSIEVEDTGGREAEAATSSSIATAPGEGWEALPSSSEVAAAIPRDVPPPPAPTTTTTTIAPVLAPPVAEVSPDPAPVAVQGGDSIWDRLAQCESGGNWSINTGNGHYGGLQFTLQSWRGVGGTGYPHEHTRAEQILRAERLLALQGWGAWPGCSRRLGLR